MTLSENAVKLLTNGVSLAVASSAGSTIGAILKNALPEPENKIQTIKYAVGVVALSGAAAKAAGNWARNEIIDAQSLAASFKKSADTPTE